MMPREARVRVNRELDLLAGAIREYATNVSRSGVLLRATRPRRVGELISLRFSVILDDFEVIRGLGEVVRVAERPRSYGIRFLELDSESRDVLARLCARAIERGEAKL